VSLVTIFWRYVKGAISRFYNSPPRIPKWTPFELAARLRSMQQGANNVGNTHQNLAALLAAAIVEANAPTNPQWARWRPSLPYKLQINMQASPNYVPPVGTND
jgi:hypothetical protein